MVLLGLNLTVSSTCFSQPSDSLCFTTEDAKTLLKFAKRGVLCDSLSLAYQGKISTLEDIIGVKNSELLLCEDIIVALKSENDKYRRREVWFKLGLGALGGALVVFIIL